MKSKPTPIPYPTTKEEEYKWGFDIHKPEGTPMARVMDWSSPGVGWGVPSQRAMEVLVFQVGEDLSQISVDEWVATMSTLSKMVYQVFYNTMQDSLGIEKTIEIARKIGYPGGQMEWMSLQGKFGAPVPLDKIMWYQDFFHLLCGPTMRPYSWFDERKGVVTRHECTNKPPQGMEEGARYCRACCDASTEGYMSVEPDLLIVRVPDIGERAEEPRCVHLFTYDKEVMEKLPAKLKRRIPETTKKVLKDKGVRL